MPDDTVTTARPATGATAAARARAQFTRAWPLVCAIVAGVATYLLILPGGLSNDDLFNLQQVRARGLWDVLFEPVFFTQVAPGHRVLTALQLAVGPADRIVMHGLLAALVAACVVLSARIVSVLTRPTWWAPVVLATTLAGPAGLATSLWYAAAFHVLPSLAAGLLAVLLYVHWRGSDPDVMPDGRPVGAVVAIAVGLLFHVKVLLAVLFLVLLEYVVVRRGDVETLAMAVGRHRRIWTPFALLAAAYWLLTRGAGIEPSFAGVTSTVEAVLRGLVFLSLPMLAGLAPGTPREIDAATAVPPIAAWAAGAVIIALVLQRGAVARRGLAVGLVVLTAGIGLSAAVRVPEFGLDAALTPRYHLDGLVYLVLGAAIGVITGRATGGATGPTRDTRRGMVLGAVSMTALVAVASWSNATTVTSSSIIRSGAWLDTVADSLAAAGPDPQLLDGPLPAAVVPAFPGWRTMQLDGLLDDLEVTASMPESVLTASGTLEPFDARPIFDQVGAAYSTNGLVSTGQDAVVLGDAVCTTSWMTLDLVLAPSPEPRYIELTLSGGADARIDYVPREGQFPEPYAEAVTPEGTHTVLLPMDLQGWVARVDLDVRTAEGSSRACLDRVRFLEVLNDLPGSDELARSAG